MKTKNVVKNKDKSQGNKHKLPKSIIKSTTIKLSMNNDDKTKLFNRINDFNMAAKDFSNKIMMFSGETIRIDGTYVNTLDLQREVYNSSDIKNELSFGEFSSLSRSFYEKFIGKDKPRGMTNFLDDNKNRVLNVFKDSVYKEISTGDTFDEEELKKKYKLSIKKLEEQGIIIKELNDSKLYNFCQLLRKYDLVPFSCFKLFKCYGYRYSIAGECNRRIKSFKECNEKTKKEFQESQDSIQKLLSKIQPNILKLIKEFVDFFYDSQNKVSIHNFQFNKKFLFCYSNTFIPNFKKGNVISHGFYERFNGEKESYNCPIEIAQKLYELKGLWENTNYLEEHYDVIEKYLKHIRLHSDSNFKSIDTLTSPASILLGENYVKFSLEDNKDGESLLLKFRSNIKSKNDKEAYKCFYRSSYVKKGIDSSIKKRIKNFYLQDLQIKRIGANYEFKFKINGKKEVVASVKEPRLLLVNRSAKTNIGKINARDFDIYLSIPLNIGLENITNNGFSLKEINSIRTWGNTSYPFSKGDQLALKSNLNIPNINNRNFRVMGVDLGINPVFAFSCFEYDQNAKSNINGLIGNFNLISEGKLHSPGTDENTNKYNLLKNKLISVKKLINSCKNYIKTKDISCISEKYCNMLGINITDLQTQLNMFIQKDIPMYQWYKHECIITSKTKELHSLFKSYKHSRKINYKESTLISYFSWIQLCETYKNCMRSIYSMGRPSFQKNAINKYAFHFSKVRKLINNCKKDLIFKLANKIVTIAKENKVQLIVLEKLDGVSKYNSKDKNSLFSLWSPSKIKETIEQAALAEGILITSVLSSYTSQVEFYSGTFGYRNDDNKHELYYKVNGQINKVDSDINASKNIAKRWFTKSCNMNYFNVKTNGKYAVIEVSSDAESNKRSKGFLTSKFNSFDVKFEIKQDKVNVIQDIDPKEILDKKERFYIDGNDIITKEEKLKRIEDIKNIVSMNK